MLQWYHKGYTMNYYPALYAEKMHEVLNEKKATLPVEHDIMLRKVINMAKSHSVAMYEKTGRTPAMFKTADFLDYLAYRDDGYELAFSLNAYLAFLDTRLAMAEDESSASVERFVKAFGEERLYKDIPLVSDGDEAAVKRFVESTIFKFIMPIIFVPFDKG